MRTASHLFVATERRPNIDDLGLEAVGVAVAKSGIVAADKRLATSVPGIWVAGGVRGGPLFTHTSWDDHRILLSQIVGEARPSASCPMRSSPIRNWAVSA